MIPQTDGEEPVLLLQQGHTHESELRAKPGEVGVRRCQVIGRPRVCTSPQSCCIRPAPRLPLAPFSIWAASARALASVRQSASCITTNC